MRWFGPTTPAYPELREIVVHTKDKRSIRGILYERRREYLVLKNSTHLTQPTGPLDGEVFVYVKDVSFVQVLGTT